MGLKELPLACSFVSGFVRQSELESGRPVRPPISLCSRHDSRPTTDSATLLPDCSARGIGQHCDQIAVQEVYSNDSNVVETHSIFLTLSHYGALLVLS